MTKARRHAKSAYARELDTKFQREYDALVSGMKTRGVPEKILEIWRRFGLPDPPAPGDAAKRLTLEQLREMSAMMKAALRGGQN